MRLQQKVDSGVRVSEDWSYDSDFHIVHRKEAATIFAERHKGPMHVLFCFRSSIEIQTYQVIKGSEQERNFNIGQIVFSLLCLRVLIAIINLQINSPMHVIV